MSIANIRKMIHGHPFVAICKFSRKKNMLYTIGHKRSYEKYFEEQGIPYKLGRNNNYNGGSVWNDKYLANKEAIKTSKEKKEEYIVYGVLANWDTDTVENNHPNVTWRDLLITSPLVKLK